MTKYLSLEEFRRTRRLGTDDAGEPIFLYMNGESDKLDTGVYIHVTPGEFQLYLENAQHVHTTLCELEAMLYAWCVSEGRIRV